MMIFRLGCVVFFTALLLCAPGCWLGEGSVLNFAKRVTKIPIPEHTQILSEYDNLEYEAMGKYQLRAQDIPAFVASHPFVPVPSGPSQLPIMHFNSICHSNLIPLSDSIPSPDIRLLQYFTGCTPDNTRTFILDEKTGELWINIQYPDPGGLASSCKL